MFLVVSFLFVIPKEIHSFKDGMMILNKEIRILGMVELKGQRSLWCLTLLGDHHAHDKPSDSMGHGFQCVSKITRGSIPVRPILDGYIPMKIPLSLNHD